jgi:hypothetical protein
MYFMYLICTKNKLFSSSKWPICATITWHICTFSSLIKYSRETLYPGTTWRHAMYRNMWNKPLFQNSPAIITLVFFALQNKCESVKKMGLIETSVFIKVSFCLTAAGFLLLIIGWQLRTGSHRLLVVWNHIKEGLRFRQWYLYL